MNPEFRRNLWLQWSPQRAVLMPLVLLLIGLSVGVLSDDGELWRDLGRAFAVLMGLMAAAWGSQLALASINQEVAERTWDQQRLSSLGPWQMTWGKLLGAASYAWYGALLCAAVVAVCAVPQGALGQALPLLAAGAAAALAAHAWAMAARLHVLDARQIQSAHSAFGWLLLVMLMMGAQALLGLWDWLDAPADDGPGGGWWQLGWPAHWQALALALSVLALGLLAAWRSMSEQLMVRTTPWAWPLGCVGLGLVVAGFVPPDEPLAQRVLMAVFGVALVATGFNLLAVTESRLRWQSLGYHARQRQWRRWAQALPLWPLSWALAALCLLLLLPMPQARAERELMAPLLLYALRCAGLVLFFAWGPSRRPPVAPALLAALVLDVLLPLVLGARHGGAWLMPWWPQGLASADELSEAGRWTAMTAQLLAVAALLLWRWRRAPATVQINGAA